MNKIVIMLGAAAMTLAVANTGAEAKTVHYTINGKRYSYNSKDPQQVEVARKRIEAANAVDAAKAKAAAEKGSTPLVGIFGSQAQREAAQAQTRLDEALADPAQSETTSSTEPARSVRKHTRGTRTGKAAHHGRPAAQQAPSRASDAADETATDQAAKDPAAKDQTATLDQHSPSSTALAPNAADSGSNKAKPTVKSVSFDVESGIKTTFMSDGSVQEEPFDTSMMTKIAPAQEGSGTLTEFVNQLRKASPSSTGSTTGDVGTASNNPPPQPQN